MEQLIEKIIEEDISDISNKTVRTKRERALRKYYQNPNYCQYCGCIIHAVKNVKIGDTKSKKFCNRSCSAKYNNSFIFRERMKSIAESCSDAEFINAYNESCSYVELGKAIGYLRINSDISKKIKKRMQTLGLQDYQSTVGPPINSLTKGDLIRKRPNWQSWRSSIQKGARAQYEASNKHKACYVCGYDKTYEVAHIKPVSDFDDTSLISVINDVDNLIALCPNHHWEFDHLGLDISEYLL